MEVTHGRGKPFRIMGATFSLSVATLLKMIDFVLLFRTTGLVENRRFLSLANLSHSETIAWRPSREGQRR